MGCIPVFWCYVNKQVFGARVSSFSIIRGLGLSKIMYVSFPGPQVIVNIPITDIRTRDLLTGTDPNPTPGTLYGCFQFLQAMATVRGKKYVLLKVFGFKIMMAYFSPVREVVVDKYTVIFRREKCSPVLFFFFLRASISAAS